MTERSTEERLARLESTVLHLLVGGILTWLCFIACLTVWLHKAGTFE